LDVLRDDLCINFKAGFNYAAREITGDVN